MKADERCILSNIEPGTHHVRSLTSRTFRGRAERG